MPTLQIRNLPERVYRALAEKARRERRSLSGQAIVELERLTAKDRRLRRLDAVRELRTRLAIRGEIPISQAPVHVIREDRDR